MTPHFVRPPDEPIPQPSRPSMLSRVWFRLTHLMSDTSPTRFEDRRLPMIGFGGGVRQMFDLKQIAVKFRH
jgi:hypothetical protein